MAQFFHQYFTDLCKQFRWYWCFLVTQFAIQYEQKNNRFNSNLYTIVITGYLVRGSRAKHTMDENKLGMTNMIYIGKKCEN